MTIKPGDKVLVTTAFGDVAERRALSEVTQGLDFLVVWVCDEQEWAAALAEEQDPRGTPWPAESVRLVDPVNA